MRHLVELGEAPSPAVLDGALSLALSTGATVRLVGPLTGADAALVLAAARIGDADKLEEARAGIARAEPIELAFGHARAGVHLLDLPDEGAVARALWSFAWPLALLGRPSELRLSGANHTDGVATFHELSLAWAPLAARFGLKASLELLRAGFNGETGEIAALLDPAPALTPFHVVHRGILRQVTLVAATAEGRDEEPLRAAQAAARKLRVHGVNAESERVPLPHTQQAARAGRWALTAVAEFENSVVSASALGTPRERPALLGPESPQAPEAVGEKVADRVARFLSGGGAIDGRMAERLLVPSILCASGLGARAGTPPTCHFTTSVVTDGLVSLATLARRMLPVRAVVDGAVGEEGVVVVAPPA
ncbi:MAG: RNA 3'-terminal phosphate cyclase [Myxococcales bacterium]